MICIPKMKAKEAEPTYILRGQDGPLEYISASRLNCWMGCRRKFYFRYVLKLSTSTSPALHVGKSVHAALQDWNHARWAQKPLARENLQKRFYAHWDDELKENPVTWKTEQDEIDQCEHSWKLVVTYLDSNTIPEGEALEGVEVRIEAELDDLPPLLGIVDLVREGGRVVDFKTAAKTPNEETAAFTHGTQLSLYALLYREATGKEESGMELHHLIKTKQPKVLVQELPPVTDRKIAELNDTLHRYVDSVIDEDWTPSPNFMCGSCEFFEQCQKWKGASA